MDRSSDARSEVGVSRSFAAGPFSGPHSGGDSHPFEARYHGRCAECREHIAPGDLVRYQNSSLVHVDCQDALAVPVVEKPLVICQTCWLAKPCECDDAAQEVGVP